MNDIMNWTKKDISLLEQAVKNSITLSDLLRMHQHNTYGIARYLDRKWIIEWTNSPQKYD